MPLHHSKKTFGLCSSPQSCSRAWTQSKWMRSWEGYEAPWDVLQHPHATVLTPPLSPPSGEAREDHQRPRHCKARQTLAWRVLCSPRPLHDCEGQPRRGSLRPRRHCSCCKRCHCRHQRSRHELTATADTAATTTARAWWRHHLSLPASGLRVQPIRSQWCVFRASLA